LGFDPTPDSLGLVAFDPVALGEQLRALDLAGRPPTPRHVGAKLVELLLRARNSDTARRLRTHASAADVEADVDEATAADMVRAVQVLLDTVGDGVKLTAAGSPPQRMVRTVCDELDLDSVWIGAGNREDQTLPVLVLRQTAQRLGMLRKVKGRLVPTARGRTLAGDALGRWWRLAGALPLGVAVPPMPRGRPGVLLPGLMAAGSTDAAEVAVAELLTGLRRELEGGQPIDRRTAIGLIADDVALLRRVGALDGDGFEDWPGAVTPGGRALARAALADRWDGVAALTLLELLLVVVAAVARSGMPPGGAPGTAAPGCRGPSR